MANTILNQDDLKKALEAKASLLEAEKNWRYVGQFPNGDFVATYLNYFPPQGAGEAMVSGNLEGPFNLWIYIVPRT